MMDQRAAIVCNAFLQRDLPEKKEALLRFLPSHQKHQIESLPTPFKDPIHVEHAIDVELSKIHYSWFTPFLRMLPENEIRLFLSVLSPSQLTALKKELLFSNHLPTLTKPAKKFLQEWLFKTFQADQKELLPIEYLPEHALNMLTLLNSEELNHLIDLLSMRDLAHEIKQIIDTAQLKKIHHALSKEELSTLKTLMHHKEPITFKRITLEHWDGQTETLRALLRQRGVNRLAKALFGQSSSLLWHVSHHMEMTTATTLMQLCTPLDHPRAHAILSSQVIEALETIEPQHLAQK